MAQEETEARVAGTRPMVIINLEDVDAEVLQSTGNMDQRGRGNERTGLVPLLPVSENEAGLMGASAAGAAGQISQGASSHANQTAEGSWGVWCFRQRIKDPPLFAMEGFILGMILPYFASTLSVILWTYSYPHCPAVLYGWMILLLVISLALMLQEWNFPSKGKQKALTLHDPLPGFTHPTRNRAYGIFFLFMSMFGCIAGRYNYYTNSFPLLSLDDRQVYKDVNGGDNPLLHSDAGLLYFSKKSSIDSNIYRGFRYRSTEFCASPILDGSKFGGYFAIGLNCCQHRWECGNGTQGIVKPRYEERMFSPPEEEKYFKVAAAAAAETFHLALRPNPIFVTLTKDVLEERLLWENYVFGYTLLPIVAAAFPCFFMSSIAIIIFRRKMVKS